MTKKWDKHKDVIVRLYKEQNLPLHEVKKILEDKHQFKASIRAFRTRLDKWGIQKYNCQRRSSAASTHYTGQSTSDNIQPVSPTFFQDSRALYSPRQGHSRGPHRVNEDYNAFKRSRPLWKTDSAPVNQGDASCGGYSATAYAGFDHQISHMQYYEPQIAPFPDAAYGNYR